MKNDDFSKEVSKTLRDIVTMGGKGSVQFMPEVSTKAIRAALMHRREMKIVSAKEWNKFSWAEIRMLLHETATYVAPTLELCDYLDELIDDWRTIEICAGNGYIGRELGIPITDSCIQRDCFSVVMTYKLFNQPLIKYPRDIIKMEALEAVRQFQPHTVIGCYATHKYSPETGDGSAYGVDFLKLLPMVQRLVLVDNLDKIATNPLMKFPHQEVKLEGLITRNEHAENNRIFIWEND